jgi:hypothetical protein
VSFDPGAFLDNLRRQRDYTGQLVYAQTIPARNTASRSTETPTRQRCPIPFTFEGGE